MDYPHLTGETGQTDSQDITDLRNDVTRAPGRDYLDRSMFGYVAVFIFLPECLFHD